MSPKVTVFIDYQNTHQTAHETYMPLGTEIYDSLLDPGALAERLVSKRAPGGVLHQVRVYRGKPDPRKEPLLASFNDKHFDAWKCDPRVIIRRRTLRYPSDWGEPGCTERPREKGIDVELAIDLVRLAVCGDIEVGIVLTRDTDLVPAIEAVRDFKWAHVETAGWDTASRLRVSGVYHHELSREDFEACRDRRYYGSGRRG
jgi:uncharacterized LabA/DUF88 family protein